MSRLPRRSFLLATTATVAAATLPRTSWGSSDSSEIRVAVIGVRGRGTDHIRGMRRNVVALCDVDEKILAQRVVELQERGGKPIEAFADFRKLLERQDIDAVSIATPNHSHALIAIEACMAGKDVYVEKPVSHNVWEGRQLVNAASRYDRIVQCGTQSRSSPSLQQAVEFVRSGKLGPISFALGTCYKPRASIGKLNKPLQIPPSIDYDLWCGPAAKVGLFRPELHYDWHWDFNTGNGDMGNQGIHQMDIARWFLGYDTLSPRVISIGGRLGYEDAGNTPNTQVVWHDYPTAPLIFETRGLPRSKQDQQPYERWKSSMDNYRGSQIGVIVQCEKGHVVIPSYTKAQAFDEQGELVASWDGGGDHYQNFLDAVARRDGSSLNGKIHDGHLSSGLCHTGGISHRVGTTAILDEIRERVAGQERLRDAVDRMAAHLRANDVPLDEERLTLGEWLEMDVTEEVFTNSDAANRLLTRDYRAGFRVPEVKLDAVLS